MTRPKAAHLRLVALTAILSVTSLVGCSDDTVSDRWGVGEPHEEPSQWPQDWQLEDLQGPLEAPGGYRGRIGDTLYFAQNRLWTASPTRGIVTYSPSSGWQPAPDAVFEAVYGGAYPRQEFVAVGDFHFFFDTDDAKLLRTDDGGASWEELAAPPMDHFRRLKSDGRHLFVVEPAEDGLSGLPSQLWRSEDYGESWQVIREDIRHGYIRTFEDMLLAVTANGREADTYMRSTDRGETWQQLGSVFELGAAQKRLGDRRWKTFGDARVTVPHHSRDETGATIGVIGAEGLVELRSIDGLGDNQFVQSLAPCDGALYTTVFEQTDEGRSNVGSLGAIDAALSSYTPVELPEGVRVKQGIGDDEVYCVDDGALLLMTTAGVLRSDDGGRSWRQVGSPFSTPDFAFDWGERLYSGEFAQSVWSYGRQDGRGDHWRAESLVPFPQIAHMLHGNDGITDIEQAGGRLYVSVDTDEARSLYRIDEPGAQAQRIWHADFDNGLAPKTDVEVDAQRVVMAALTSRHSFVFSLDGGRSFEPLAFPETEMVNFGVSSLGFHDGTLWVVYGRKIWKVDLEEQAWEDTTATFPEEMPDYQTPDELRSAGGELVAFWDKQVYLRADGRWRSLMSDELRAQLEVPQPGELDFDAPSIVDVTVKRGRVLIATEERVAVVGLDDRSSDIFETGSDVPIYRLFNLDSGLYVGFDNGGLHRLADVR